MSVYHFLSTIITPPVDTHEWRLLYKQIMNEKHDETLLWWYVFIEVTIVDSVHLETLKMSSYLLYYIIMWQKPFTKYLYTTNKCYEKVKDFPLISD